MAEEDLKMDINSGTHELVAFVFVFDRLLYDISLRSRIFMSLF